LREFSQSVTLSLQSCLNESTELRCREISVDFGIYKLAFGIYQFFGSFRGKNTVSQNLTKLTEINVKVLAVLITLYYRTPKIIYHTKTIHKNSTFKD